MKHQNCSNYKPVPTSLGCGNQKCDHWINDSFDHCSLIDPKPIGGRSLRCHNFVPFVEESQEVKEVKEVKLIITNPLERMEVE